MSAPHLRALCALGLMLFPGLVPAGNTGFGHYAPAVRYHERTSHTFYLPMRDGVRLAVRVTRPAIGARAPERRFPVIWTAALSVSEPRDLANTRAGQSAYRDINALTDYGYVVVQVARRGNGQSFGIRRGYNDRTEAYDAYEITEWLAAQPWSSGAVGVYGCSNTGDAAMHAVTAAPPHLKAAFAGCFSWNKWDAFHRGGIYAQWGTGPQRTIEQDTAIEPVEADTDRSLLRQAAEEHQQSTNLVELWRSMPDRDSWAPSVASRFWYEGSISSYAAQIRRSGVAVYIQGGWHDELRDQGLIALLNIPNSRILIGPWTHCMSPDFPLLQEILRFFDTYLKGIRTGLQAEPRVHYFRMNDPGKEPWRASRSWPVASMHARRLFLEPAGTLGTRSPGMSAERRFNVNKHVSCPTAQAGPYAQPCHLDGEGLSFAGEPLDRQADVTGNPIVSLKVAADRSDVSLFGYLEDVAPDGSISVVTEGRQRLGLRALTQAPWRLPDTPWHRGWRQDEMPMVPGEPVVVEFDLMPTSYIFAAGHRIQLTITGADFRESARAADADGTEVTIESDPRQPAYLDLPVVE